jgi:hypothetical protein
MTFDDWTAEDQRRIDSFTRDVLQPIYAPGDAHTLFVVAHGFAQALGHVMAHDLEHRPELQAYYLQVCERLRAHVERAVPASLREH